MTLEQQRTAIAEACGWKCNGHADQIAATVGWEFAYQFVIAPEGKLVTHNSIPDYLNDLNAMHEAILLIGAQYWSHYNEVLMSVVDQGPPKEHMFFIYNATAAQRAEAFLRTIGKWEEAK